MFFSFSKIILEAQRSRIPTIHGVTGLIKSWPPGFIFTPWVLYLLYIFFLLFSHISPVYMTQRPRPFSILYCVTCGAPQDRIHAQHLSSRPALSSCGECPRGENWWGWLGGHQALLQDATDHSQPAQQSKHNTEAVRWRNRAALYLPPLRLQAYRTLVRRTLNPLHCTEDAWI